MRHRLWILPIIMLALAAIACDGESFPIHTITVDRVVADQEVDGRAFALVIDRVTPQNTSVSSTFVTENYGGYWTAWEGDFPEHESESLPLEIEQSALLLDSTELWRFPPPSRLKFFNPSYQSSGNLIQRFRLPSHPSNALQGDTIYVALGTEGVLVGPAPGTNSTRQWMITNDGITPLFPLILTIDAPEDILNRILWAIFLLPPLPLFHAYALVRVWAYLIPLTTAWRRALLVSLGLAVLGSIGAVIWFIQIESRYEVIVGVLTAVIVVIGLFVTRQFTKSPEIEPAKRWRYVLAAATLSLIAPSQFVLNSVLPTTIVIGFFCWWFVAKWYFGARGILRRPLDQQTRWQLDNLALESFAIMITITLVGYIFRQRIVIPLLNLYFNSGTADTILFIVFLVIAGWWIEKRFKVAAQRLHKSNEGEVRYLTWYPSIYAYSAWFIFCVVFVLCLVGLVTNVSF